jgi:protein involved in polysaccharide export with SLBB domain
MKKNSALYLFPLAFVLNAQVPSDSNLDPNFVDSLADELSGEVIIMNDVDEDEKIDELFNSQTSLEKTKLLLKKMRMQLEAIEDRMAADNQKDEVELELFGNEFFRTLQTTFAPINMPNQDGSYIVDVGDRFSINVLGDTDIDLVLDVSRDGSLAITGFGKVYVAGLTLSEVEAKLEKYFAAKVLGSETIVDLKKLRDIQVLIIGKVEMPGMYTLTGGSSVLSAISAAGGMLENGSFRGIELIRNGKIIQEIDLYQFLVFGDNNLTNIKLRSGDTLRIPAANFHVPISGGINTNAIFELVSGETIEDLINFAGGFSQDHYGYDYLSLYRSSLNSLNFLTIEKDQYSNYILLPRDTVLVPSFDNDLRKQMKVSVIGRVKNPGVYFINEGDKLSDVIRRSGGYLDDAYIYAAALFRNEAIDKQKTFSQKNYVDTVSHVISTIGKKDAFVDERILPILQEEIKATEFDGRVIATFDLDELARDPSKDLVLKDNDKIIVPQLEKVVYLFGDFNSPTNIVYESGFTPDDYIKLAGGPKKSAEDYVIIVNPDGTSASYNPGLFKLNPPDIYPGSIIYAPRDVGRLDGIEFSATLAPILSSLAISLASLNSIND